ncbi:MULTISPECIES: hypothetical protein [Yersinia]|uniref:hypothetical protein n=1 Tax=Yersinia TaxID=629 RepID=UPI001D11B13C|nr:hypothetical protein [Yersinia proxima]
MLARLLVILAMSAAWLTGWNMHASRVATIELAMTKIAAINRAQFEDVASASARQLENKLTELKANEVHTERLIRTEIIKPVFSTVCATDEYVRLFNASAERAERTLSGKLVDPLPGNAATPDR